MYEISDSHVFSIFSYVINLLAPQATTDHVAARIQAHGRQRYDTPQIHPTHQGLNIGANHHNTEKKVLGTCD